jgi:adenylate kinase family enzyme
MDVFTSQLEWLEYCTMNGLLVPNRWTQDLIAAHIEHTPALRNSAFILDGYPRTVAAAKHLLELLRRVDIPVSMVLHLSISKQEMISRARLRGRQDDDEQALLSRYNFYVESVQPSVDFLKLELGPERVALIDAHQPVYEGSGAQRRLKLEDSISNVVTSVLLSIGVPAMVIRDLLDREGPATVP